jgi:hypothetical protein
MLRLLNRRLAREDSGFALLTVIASMFVLTLVATAALTYAMQSQVASRYDQDWTGALAAAQAGVDDYLAHMNKVDTYWQQTPGFPGGAWDCTGNIALQQPLPGAPCGWGATTKYGWGQVPDAPGARFHYNVDYSSAAATGTVTLTSTGWVKGKTRSIQTILGRLGFGEFLYFTDYETVDPANDVVYNGVGSNFDTNEAYDACAHHYWDPLDPSATPPSKPRDTTGTSQCQDINFIGNATAQDILDGPVHSNDAILMSGTPKFLGTVTTSYPNCKGVTTKVNWPKCYRINGSATPTLAGGIAYRDAIQMQDSIGSLKQYVDASTTTNPGCGYVGPTRIKFTGDGFMQVWSKYSTAVNTNCGTLTALQSAAGSRVKVPDNNVIVVSDVPASQAAPTSGACPTGGIGDGLPVANDVNTGYTENNCRSGNAWVEGSVQGRVTISTDSNIVITGDLTYAGGQNGTDVLGLVANNSIKIYHPYGCTSVKASGACATTPNPGNLPRPNGSTFSNPKVYAAIQSLQHSFTVQSYDVGSALGSLTVYGAIAQRYRGPVGTGSGGSAATGYYKDYHYDRRLRYAPPPFFLPPVKSSWGMKTYGEIQPQLRNSGP